MMRRRAGESIRIGPDIAIHIAHIGRSRVKIAIEAPRDVRVVATEVEVVGEQNRAAAASRAAAAAAGLIARALEKNGQACRTPSDMDCEVDPGHPPLRRTRARQDAG